MSNAKPETVNWAEIARHGKEVSRYHGAPDVEYVLGYSNSANFYGERVLSIGDMGDRWDIADRMRGQGADVTVIDTFTDGRPDKRVKPNSKIFEGKKYDRTVIAMTGALRNPKERVQLFDSVLRKTDFKNGGRMGITALDYSSFQEDAAENGDANVLQLAVLSKKFLDLTQFDSRSGATLEAEVSQVIEGKKNLQADVTVNERAKGREHWGEVDDLLAFQTEVLDGALKNPFLPTEVRRNFNVLQAEIRTFRSSVAEILSLPLEDRPELTPPRIVRAVVTQKEV